MAPGANRQERGIVNYPINETRTTYDPKKEECIDSKLGIMYGGWLAPNHAETHMELFEVRSSALACRDHFHLHNLN